MDTSHWFKGSYPTIQWITFHRVSGFQEQQAGIYVGPAKIKDPIGVTSLGGLSVRFLKDSKSSLRCRTR